MGKNIITFLCAGTLLFLSGKLITLPWWIFTVPVFVLGIVTALLKWEIKAFASGFLAGFIVWLGMNTYSDFSNGGIIFERMATLMAVHKIVVLLAAGITGGLLTGFALYAGKGMISKPIIIKE